MNNIFIDKFEIERQLDAAEKVNALLGSGERSVYILTFGCQQNEADSEQLAGICALMGYKRVDSGKKADLIILNTCAIREHAELKALSKTGQLRKLKEENKELIVAICGCMIEEDHRRGTLYKSYPYVDFMFGTDRLFMLPEMILTELTGKKRKIYVSDLPHDEFGVIAEGMPVERESAYKARVSIMYGCNNYCSYCVVPNVRGRERSRDASLILEETRGLVRSGYKDIMLLGQNVNSYKGDLSFPQLLSKCASFDGEYWVRFMTSHPKDASRELVEVMAENPNVAHHFHLPFQAGSNRILKLMNRKYTIEEYMEKALYIKERVPDVSLTTDVICGFPTETDEEFMETYDTVSKIGFDMIFTFLYSPRENTPAAKMDGQIPHEEKVRRFSALSDLQNEKADNINREYVGKTLRVLSEGKENGIFSGRTTQNKIVTFTVPPETEEQAAAGKMLNVTITQSAAYTLTGKTVTCKTPFYK